MYRMAFYLNVSYLLTYLSITTLSIIIYHYMPSSVFREHMKAHPWTSCSIFATNAARTVPCCCCARGHFECGVAGGALPVERCRCLASTAGRAQQGPPPLHYSPLLLPLSVQWRHEHFPQFRQFDHFILDYNILGETACALRPLGSPSAWVRIKDIIIKDKVIELAKLRKMLMPSVDTRGQQQSRVVKERGIPSKLLMPHNCSTPPSLSKCPDVQQGTVFAAFVAKIEQFVHGCAFVCFLETLEGM